MKICGYPCKLQISPLSLINESVLSLLPLYLPLLTLLGQSILHTRRLQRTLVCPVLLLKVHLLEVLSGNQRFALLGSPPCKPPSQVFMQIMSQADNDHLDSVHTAACGLCFRSHCECVNHKHIACSH